MTSATTAAALVPGPPPWRKALQADIRSYWPLWLIVVLTIFLRLYEVHRLPGMQGDEAWYGLQARLWLRGEEIAWRTPTGNVPGMLHLWSLIFLHALFEPSLLLLRLPTIASSIAAMLLAYAIGRRFFGRLPGMVAMLMMACLPINIAYARLGWDPSHSAMLVLAAAYAVFAGRKLLGALLFAIALTNHPSAVFTAPFLVLGFLGFGLTGQPRAALQQTLGLAALLAVAILLAMAISPSTSHYLSLPRTMTRLIDGSAWLGFGQMFGRLLSGDTVYAYIFGTGFGAARPWADWSITLGLVAAVATGAKVARTEPHWPTLGLMAGWLVSLALLYLVAGLWVMSPTLERFAFPMVALTALAIAAASSAVPANRHIWVQLLAAVSALVLLAGFWTHYLRPLDGGEVPPTRGFWTAPQDPNLAAYRIIAAQSSHGGHSLIVAEDWWLRIPLAYYAVGAPLHVIDASDRSNPGQTDRTFGVAYAGSEFDRALARHIGGGPWAVVLTNNRANSIHIWRQPAVAPTRGER